MTGDSPDFKHAHPAARRLMDEDFYYSPIEETGPFGSDDGADTFAGFEQWRLDHIGDDPFMFLEEQLQSWGYPPFDLHVTEPEIILDYCHAHELGSTFLTGMDAAIVAVAFGQLYLEGAIFSALHTLAVTAINRQLSPFLLQLWDAGYQPVRKEQLGKMLSALHRVELVN